MTSLLRALALAAIGACTALATHAQTEAATGFPSKPIHIVVPFAPGGATDVIARTVGQKLSERSGQPVVVENKAGGNGNIGASLAARAAPDGYTLLVATSSHAIKATLYRKLDYSLTRDFKGLTNMASVPLMLVVHPGLPVHSVGEFAALAKAGTQNLTYGSGGSGTAAHLAGEQFNTLVGARMVHAPYKGGAPAQADLIGGHIQAMFANLPEVMPAVQAGKLRALAVTGNARPAALPELPTFTQAGYPQIEARSWFGLFAPAATPSAVVERLSGLLAQAIAEPDVQARLKELGAEPVGNRHAAFQAFVADEVTRWGALVERSGATAD